MKIFLEFQPPVWIGIYVLLWRTFSKGGTISIYASCKFKSYIGCHTLDGDKEAVLKSTQELEKDLIRECAEEIFGTEHKTSDGFVASGGKVANIEACWIYRNYFIQEFKAKPEEIALLYSEDTHYSFPKASNYIQFNNTLF